MIRIRCLVLMFLLILVTLLDGVSADSITTGTSSSSSSTSKNHELLTKMGFARIRSPNSHHRKRLAVESRHHQRSDDSHMFIVKLPPNPHYYTYNKPINNIELPASKNLPIGFQNNGKPAKIYHWNIPVLKKIVLSKYKSRHINDNNNDDDDDHNNNGAIIDFQNPESWNEVLDKPERRKPIKPSYYVPVKTKKHSFTKYFPGNGKPHSFYVIEKSKKAHYHRLLP